MSEMSMQADREIASGTRFGFGANWARFLAVVGEPQILAAEDSLREMLRVANLSGRRFLDIGSGSGLFSLAARRLGATVHSFDFDPQSVACTQELKRRYFPGDEAWRVEQGSVLDREYLAGLGEFDVVYSWGVLHHTGAMWLALENAIARVAGRGGKLFIAIYNDQGLKSHLWWFIKYLYNKLPPYLRKPFVMLSMLLTRLMVLIKYTARLQPMTAIASFRNSGRARGMSSKYDAVDWIGGFPFEFAAYDTLTAYLQARGFVALNTKRNTSLGCSEWAVERGPCAG